MSEPAFFEDTGLSVPTYESDPIRITLPGENEAYTNNEAVYWLLRPWDFHTAAIISGLRNFYTQQLDPLTCKASSLDWLAQWAGYTGVYWDRAWPESAKRTLIAEAYTRVWPSKGSQDLLSWLFGVFGLSAQIVASSNPARADVSVVGDQVGGPVSIFHVLLPMTYSRLGEWVLVRRLIALYSPLWVGYTVSYSESRADIARAGEVVTF